MHRRFTIALCLTVAACGKSAPPQQQSPLAIRIAQVQHGDTQSVIEGAGTIAYRVETPLGFTSNGRIGKVLVQEGDRVRAGQLLASLDTIPVDAELAANRAELERAQKELQRSETLAKQGWVTRIRVDNARAAAEAAAAQVRASGFQANTAHILAPSAGEVLTRASEPGQVVAAGTAVLVLGEARGGLVMRVALSDRELGRMTPGLPVAIRMAALGSDTITGQVIEVGGRAERATGAYLVEVALPSDPRLRSGMIGSAQIAVASGPVTRPIIPPTALFAPRAGEAFVYVVGSDNRARLRRVQLAETGDGGAQVKAGIAPGEWVAVSGIDRLRDGMQINPARRAP